MRACAAAEEHGIRTVTAPTGCGSHLFTWGGEMNKSELTEQLAEAMHLSVREAASIVNTILDTMTEALAKGGSIEIRGFGSFGVRSYEAYIGRNPKTGEQIAVQPKRLPFFKPGKGLRSQINRKNTP